MHIVFGGLGLLVGGLLLIVGVFEFDPAHREILAGFLWIFGGLAIVYLIPSLMGGIGLLKGWTWARAVIWIESAMLVVAVPIGTAMAGLALWALLTTQAREQVAGDAGILAFEAMLRRSIRPIAAGLAAIAILGVIIGLGYIFRDQLEALNPGPKQELTPLPSGIPPSLGH